MLNDSYVEYAVKSKPEVNCYLGILGGIICIPIGIFILLFDLAGVLFVIFGIALIIFFARQGKVEYEYIITNGNVEISAIYAASRRSVKKQFDASLIKYICPANSSRLAGEKVIKKYDYTSKKKDIDAYAVLIEKDEKKELVLMEFNDKCIEHMKQYLYQKVYNN